VKVLVNDPLFKSGDVEGCVNKFGVSRQTLSQIKCGQRWGHITGIPLRDKSLPIIARPKLNIDQVKAIFLTSKEIPAWKLVEKYGVSKTAVNDIRYGRSWTHITIPLMLGEYS
jgi:DNA-binding Xre family transcriptional regulator